MAINGGIAISRGVGKIAYLQLCLVVICSIYFLHNWANDVEIGFNHANIFQNNKPVGKVSYHELL